MSRAWPDASIAQRPPIPDQALLRRPTSSDANTGLPERVVQLYEDRWRQRRLSAPAVRARFAVRIPRIPLESAYSE